MKSVAYLTIRIAPDSVQVAQSAFLTHELLELRDRHGQLHKGYVRGVEYVMDRDPGWYVAFECTESEVFSATLERLKTNARIH